METRIPVVENENFICKQLYSIFDHKLAGNNMQKRVKVKPNSKRQNVEEVADDSLIVHLKSPPVEGKANEELIKLLAAKFDVPKSSIRIKSGLSSRQKLIEFDTIE